MSAVTVTLDEGDRILAFANSYTRYGEAMMLKPKMPPEDWWRLIGEYWSVCDNIGRYSSAGIHPFHNASRSYLDMMMDVEEREVFNALPEQITVYRGCYAKNKNGLSWTINRDVAEKFPLLMRYRQRRMHPLIITGAAPRDQCVFKNGREEEEIICADVKVIKVERIGADKIASMKAAMEVSVPVMELELWQQAKSTLSTLAKRIDN